MAAEALWVHRAGRRRASLIDAFQRIRLSWSLGSICSSSLSSPRAPLILRTERLLLHSCLSPLFAQGNSPSGYSETKNKRCKLRNSGCFLRIV
jgi:hypothetical protein